MALQEHREDRGARFDRWVIVPASAAAFTGLAFGILASATLGPAKTGSFLIVPNLVATVAAAVALVVAVGVAMREDRRTGKRD